MRYGCVQISSHEVWPRRSEIPIFRAAGDGFRAPVGLLGVAMLLFVDGDPDLRRSVRAALARRGHTVRTAGDLRRAIRCLQDHGFDGVFVDVWLGEASGFDLLTWIQEHQPRLATRVVFLSGDIEPSARSRRKLRALDLPVIAKPFEIRELELHIAGWSPFRDQEGLQSRA